MWYIGGQLISAAGHAPHDIWRLVCHPPHLPAASLTAVSTVDDRLHVMIVMPSRSRPSTCCRSWDAAPVSRRCSAAACCRITPHASPKGTAKASALQAKDGATREASTTNRESVGRAGHQQCPMGRYRDHTTLALLPTWTAAPHGRQPALPPLNWRSAPSAAGSRPGASRNCASALGPRRLLPPSPACRLLLPVSPGARPPVPGPAQRIQQAVLPRAACPPPGA